MAFSPFTWFRKHQKVFFAVLTVICMLVFIGQAGVGADIFQRALRWMGVSRSSAEPVVTLYGKKITVPQLEELRKNRQLASNFLLLNSDQYHAKALKSIDKEVSASADNPLADLKKIIQNAEGRASGNLLREALLFAQQGDPQGAGQRFMLGVQFTFNAIERDLRGGLAATGGQGGLIDVYDRLRKNLLKEQEKDPEKTLDPERLAMLVNIGTVLNYQAWILEQLVALRNPDAMLQVLQYFHLQKRPLFTDSCLGGNLNPQNPNSADDLLDFMVWQRKADDLGITLTDADVIREINLEAAGQEVIDPATKSLAKEKAITDFLKTSRDYERVTAQDLINALREEFRVALAQGLLLGTEPGVRSFRNQLGGTGSPAVGTPDEFYRYYREQRTEVDVKLLPIPIEKFLDKVPPDTSDQELEKFYKRFKDKEPSPSSRDPGFKEPRRIAIQYVTGAPDDPFYRELARKEVEAWHSYNHPAAQAARCIGSVVATPVGGPIAGCAVLIGTAVQLNPEQAEYARIVLKETPTGLGKNPEKDFDSSPWRDRPPAFTTYLINKFNLASSLGILSGSTAGVGAPYAGPLALVLSAGWDETRGVLRQNILSFGILSGSTAGVGAPYAGPLMLSIPFAPAVPSRKQLEPLIRESLQTQTATEKLQGNLNTLKEELRKLKSKDRAAHDAYLKKAAAEYHLTLHTMPKPMAQQVLVDQLRHQQANALDLADLMDAYLSMEGRLQVESFVNRLFMGSGVYEPQELHGPQGREFLYWRYENLPPRVRPFKAIRAQVLEAWRLEQARKLARQEAERLEETINSRKMSAKQAEEFLLSRKLGNLFELDRVAQRVPPKEVQEVEVTDYRPYQLPSDKADLMKYPPSDLVKRLLELKDDRRATYLVDQPGRTFYVASLVKRKEPTLKEFLARYRKSLNLDPLYTLFLRSQKVDFRKAVMEQLRKEATSGKLDKEGRYDLPDSVRKREARSEEE